jgi:hypothetical protein
VHCCHAQPSHRSSTDGGSGADPAKLQKQIAQHGKSITGMPPVIAVRGSDGELIIYDDVTRATRVAKLLPGQRCPSK